MATLTCVVAAERMSRGGRAACRLSRVRVRVRVEGRVRLRLRAWSEGWSEG